MRWGEVEASDCADTAPAGGDVRIRPPNARPRRVRRRGRQRRDFKRRPSVPPSRTAPLLLATTSNPAARS